MSSSRCSGVEWSIFLAYMSLPELFASYTFKKPLHSACSRLNSEDAESCILKSLWKDGELP